MNHSPAGIRTVLKSSDNVYLCCTARGFVCYSDVRKTFTTAGGICHTVNLKKAFAFYCLYKCTGSIPRCCLNLKRKDRVTSTVAVIFEKEAMIKPYQCISLFIENVLCSTCKETRFRLNVQKTLKPECLCKILQ